MMCSLSLCLCLCLCLSHFWQSNRKYVRLEKQLRTDWLLVAAADLAYCYGRVKVGISVGLRFLFTCLYNQVEYWKVTIMHLPILDFPKKLRRKEGIYAMEEASENDGGYF